MSTQMKKTPICEVIQISDYFRFRKNLLQIHNMNRASDLNKALDYVEAANRAKERAMLCQALRK